MLEMPKTEGGSSRRSWIRQGEAAAGRMLFKTPEHTQQRHPNRNLGICGIPAENLYPRFMLAAQRFRTQERNRQDARERLAHFIEGGLHAPKPRVATKPTRGARERRLGEKRGRATIKKGRTGRDWD